MQVDLENGGTSPLEDSSPIINDPFQQVFGKQASASLIATRPDDTIPEEIVEALEEHKIGHRKFRTMLKEIPPGISDANNESMMYIRGFGNNVPSLEFIAREYGPGRYAIFIFWREIIEDPDRPGKQRPGKNRSEKILITISEKMAPHYNEHRLERKLKEARQAREKLRQSKIEKDIEDTIDGVEDKGERVDPIESGKKFVKDALDTVKMLGFHPQGGESKGINWKEIAPLLLTAAPAVLKYFGDREVARQQSQNQFMTMMISAMNNKSNDMMDLFKTMQGPMNGNQAVEEFKSMLNGVIDIKQALDGNKETVVDKIFSTVDNVLPMVLQVASQSAQARANNPMVGMAQTFIKKDPNMQQAYTDPEVRDGLIRKWDEFYGWEQTDQIIGVAGLERSENSPRRPDQRYPQGDEKNKIETVNAEVVDENESEVQNDQFQAPQSPIEEEGEINGKN